MNLRFCFRRILIFSLLILNFSCNRNKPEVSTMELKEPPMDASVANTEAEMADQQELASPNKAEQQALITSKRPLVDQKIIRTANLRFQVADFKRSTLAINQQITQHEAQLLSANESRADGTLENSLVIKVLPEKFESL